MIDDGIIQSIGAQARKFAARLGLPEDEADDLAQEALQAVLEKASGFEGTNGAEFATYAHAVAERTMANWVLTRQNTAVPVARHVGTTARRAAAVTVRLQQELGREPRNREVAEAMGLTLDQYEAARLNAAYVMEEAAPAGAEDDEGYYEDAPEALDGTGVLPGPEEMAEAQETLDYIEAGIESLTASEQAILNALYGLEDGNPRSLREVGEEIGISHEQVRKLELRAIRKLRHRMPDELAGASSLSLDGRE